MTTHYDIEILYDKKFNLEMVLIELNRALSEQWRPNREVIKARRQKVLENLSEVNKQISWVRSGIYPTRYQARKARRDNEVTVSVDGGYKNMDYIDYKNWRRQK